MREIKFRGKTIETTQWRFGSLLTPLRGALKPLIYEHLSNPTRDGSWYWHEVAPETVGQYTGLTDSNGKEIYEGDIVRFELPPMVLTNEKTAVGAVVYEYGQFLVIIHAMRFTIFRVTMNCTVIGNVHDNPELLEVTK